jgi:hypothetical protein
MQARHAAFRVFSIGANYCKACSGYEKNFAPVRQRIDRQQHFRSAHSLR